MKRIWCYLFHRKIKKWNQRLLTFNEDEDGGFPVIDIIVIICPKCGTVKWASEQISDIIKYPKPDYSDNEIIPPPPGHRSWESFGKKSEPDYWSVPE